MSGAPKRLHEEGGHSTPVKRPIEDTGIFSSPNKFNQSVNNDFHLPFEHGQEGRMPKVPRIELRDDGKRLSQLHRMSSVPSNSADHPIMSDSRLELKSSKDARDVKNDIREVKPDSRDLYADTRMDIQVSKADNSTRIDSRTDDKDLKTDRISHSDYKNDVKFEMDSWTANASHTSWKDHHRGKRYYEPSTDGLDSWRTRGLQNTDEVVKDPSISEGRDIGETREAVGENKVDLKLEEKIREKDRKRKDDKHRDFGEKDKHGIDRRSSVQMGGPISREERDNDKWDKERKDAQKEKERNDRDKEPIKREPSNVNEKETVQLEKEHVDGSVSKVVEQENALPEYKRVRDDTWKGYERDGKEKKREKDSNVGDRHELGKGHEKEPDNGCTEGDGFTEKEKEVCGGVQHRRRMSRTRGTPQASHHEARFRPRARDSEGSQGKAETSAIVYKSGECMQELLKSWKEFEASQDTKDKESMQNGPTLEIRIPAEFVTSTNRQVKGAQLWGTDVYTNDSDLVAVLMHTGYCCPTSSPPPSAIQELRAVIRILPPKDCYTSTLRNNVRSRAWGQGIGCSYRVERCCIVKKGGGTIDLEPRLTHTSAVEPTLAPVSVERTMTTRAAASNALRQQRFVREVTIQYNLCNEPWLKYAINIVADKGLKKPLYTSARLKKGEVLYLETHFNRYELCFNGEKSVSNGTASTSSQVMDSDHEKLQNHNSSMHNGDRNSSDREHIIDVFRWSRCKRAFPEKILRSFGIPLPVEHLEILEENLDWEDVQWSQTSVWVAGKEYALARVHFLSPKK